MADIYCAGEGRFFPESEFDEVEGVLLHNGSHTIAGDPPIGPSMPTPLGVVTIDEIV